MNEKDQTDQTDEQGAVAGLAATRDMIDGTGKFHSERTRHGRGAYALSLYDCETGPIFLRSELVPDTVFAQSENGS